MNQGILGQYIFNTIHNIGRITTSIIVEMDGPEGVVIRFLQQRGGALYTQCGVNFFVLGSRRVLAPTPKVPGSDVKTYLKSRFM